jgi:hypothetical protein
MPLMLTRRFSAVILVGLIRWASSLILRFRCYRPVCFLSAVPMVWAMETATALPMTLMTRLR